MLHSRARLPALLLVLLAACSSAENGGGTPGEAGAPQEEGGTPGTGGDASGDGTIAHPGSDAASSADGAGDGGSNPSDASGDGDGGPQCAPYGAPGDCISTSSCAALGDHTSYPGYCPGPADIECCIVTPSTANNPPVPQGWVLMQQSQVTSAMTTWAVQILDDPANYPMFSTTTKLFGTLDVLARVEWHPPDFQNNAIHRGVTLYEPAGD